MLCLALIKQLMLCLVVIIAFSPSSGRQTSTRKHVISALEIPESVGPLIKASSFSYCQLDFTKYGAAD